MIEITAIGGNAIKDISVLKRLGKLISKRRRRGNKEVITHGNGPQVGELADSFGKKNLALLTAQTDAELGLVIERGISGTGTKAATILTKVVVNRDDHAFKDPSKPIGRFYRKGDIAKLKGKGYGFRELIGGFRRVVPSPVPRRIVDIELVRMLLKKDYVVITCGGGGIPVEKDLQYVDAVLDKDRTSALLGRSLGASRLYILTDVDGVYLNFGKKNQKLLKKVRRGDLIKYSKKEGFEEGSIKPKIDACIDFVRNRRSIAVIGNLNKFEDVFRLRNCTVVRY